MQKLQTEVLIAAMRNVKDHPNRHVSGGGMGTAGAGGSSIQNAALFGGSKGREREWHARDRAGQVLNLPRGKIKH